MNPCKKLPLLTHLVGLNSRQSNPTICRHFTASCRRLQGIRNERKSVLGRQESRPKLPPKPDTVNRFEKASKYEAFTRRAWRRAWQMHPYSMSTSVILLTAVVGFFGYHIANYYFIVIKNLRNYPREVSTWIRQGLGYEMRNQYSKAAEAYERAIRQAHASDMDMLSDPVTGLMIKYAEVYEKMGKVEDMVRVYEENRKEWPDVLEEKKSAISDMVRSRMMVRVIGVSLKLMELYEKKEENAKAEGLLNFAVTTTLQESRQKVSANDEQMRKLLWNSEVVGSTLEQCAEYYERQDRHDLATPLFLEALANITTPTCHSVVIMNNIAATISQQPIPDHTPMDRRQQLETAKSWASKALTLSKSIPTSSQTDECKIGCVVALHNLGEFEEQMGNMRQAAKLYTESDQLAKKISYDLGIDQNKITQRRLQEERKKNDKWLFYRSPETSSPSDDKE